MKLILTREEVERIILEAIRAKMPGIPFHAVKIEDNYYRADYCVVTTKEAEE